VHDFPPKNASIPRVATRYSAKKTREAPSAKICPAARPGRFVAEIQGQALETLRRGDRDS
jgi:hypothetical protein